jgi:hypothetical protein
MFTFSTFIWRQKSTYIEKMRLGISDTSNLNILKRLNLDNDTDYYVLERLATSVEQSPLEKVRDSQLFNTFLAFYGTRRFISAFKEPYPKGYECSPYSHMPFNSIGLMKDIFCP